MDRCHFSHLGIQPRRAAATGVAILLVLAAFHAPINAAVTLSGIAPLGATVGVTVSVTGGGFAPGAADNEIILTPASGPALTVRGTAIAVLNSSTGLRRLSFTVPPGLAVGSAAVQVRNRITNETAGGRSLQIIELSVPQPIAALRGATGVILTILGSPNTQFINGRTRAIVGSGVSVTSVQEVSPTELRLTLSVAATAALGPRVVTVTASTQTGLVPTGFTVVDAPPPNRDPAAAANGPYSGVEGQPLLFSSDGSRDPDNDPLQFAWEFGDGDKSSDPNPHHAYASPGTFTATLVVSDGRGGTATATAPVTVAAAAVALDLTPPIITLRQPAATAQLALRGYFSDGSSRDLIADPATSFAIDEQAVAAVSDRGLVTAGNGGIATITARFGGLSATSQVRVILTSEAPGFVRGEVYDDTRGIPLGDATATLISSAGGAVQSASPTAVDERGRFALTAPPGAAVFRLGRPGFTAVDRVASIAANGVTTLFDARLTPLDSRVSAIQSVFGGEAASADGSTTLSIPAGSLDADATLRITPISNQGLAGLLPAGWSPIAAVDVQPYGRQLAVAASLRVPHADTLAAGAPVTVVRYDTTLLRWVVLAPGIVSADRRALNASLDATGQFAFVVPDTAPAVPPLAVPGEALLGVEAGAVPADATASGDVIPRSAPPGDGARATGAIVLQPPVPLTSGVAVRARVSELFSLLDNTAVVPLPFVQDVVLYARPRLGVAGSLATRLPITPTLQFSVQQLSRGTVRLDVTRDEPAVNAAIVGSSGGSITDAAGNVLELPSGVLASDAAIGLLPLTATQLSAPVPSGFTLLGAALIDAIGQTFAAPVLLSVPRIGGVPESAQVVVAQVVTDIAGHRRFQMVGVGQLTPARITIQQRLGSLDLGGVRSGGEFVFLQSLQSIGFIAGVVDAAGSGVPLALVTSDTAPFAFVTGADGRYFVAGRVGSTQVAANNTAGAAASAAASLGAVNEVAVLNLSLAETPPMVVATTPGREARSIPLDSSIVVDFSKPIDPSSVNASSVILTAGATTVATQTLVSANRRRVTVTPLAPLAGLTAYRLALTSEIRDAAGAALAAFAPLSFTTLDPSKAVVLALGVITAELPDEDGLSLVIGAVGAAEPQSAVVATNVRTQETVTVLSAVDGSFRLRVAAIIGDEVLITLRDANGRQATLSITQFSSQLGASAIGERGGTFEGPGGRVGRVLPRALSAAGVFLLGASEAAPLPALPPSAAVVDRFSLAIEGAQFRRLDSLTLTDSQGRFAPASAFAAPFTATAAFAIPADFLVSASTRFLATVVDRDGVRRNIQGGTLVVAAAADPTAIESASTDQFPSLYLRAPKEAISTQLIEVSAIAPAARVELDLPTSTDPLPPDESVLLARLVNLAGARRLSLVDRLERTDVGGLPRLRTAGREWPGLTGGGEYAVIRGEFAFVSGRISGPAATVMVAGTPFTFDTDTSNGAFIVAVVPGSPFSLQFVDKETRAVLGTASGIAPAAGVRADIGVPLAPPGTALTVTVEPGPQAIVDINAPVVFTFSESLDRASITSSAFLVTDDRGAQVFGTHIVSADGTAVTFAPLRRWRFDRRYQYTVATSVTAVSGARLVQPHSGSFTTFTPRVVGSLPVDGARDVAVSGAMALVAGNAGVSVIDLAASPAGAIGSSIPVAGGARGVALLATPLVDRNGAAVTGPFAVIAGGNATVAGVLQTWSLTPVSAPALLGSSQITTPLGEAAPPGVPAHAGIPNAVLMAPDGSALASSRDVGFQSVALGAAIPANPAQPGGALRHRYPSELTADAIESALLGDRVVVATSSALTVVNASTLIALGTTAALGRLGAVAALPNARFDMNGDGQFADHDVFDLVLAGDDTGVLAVYKVSTEGVLELVSVIRTPSADAIRGITISAAEELAYVGVGLRGVVVVDLRGPASVQPVDQNRDGIDDRILGSVDTPGIAGRIALDLSRGVARVADSSGLTTIQIIPPRVRFLTLRRDPIRGRADDDQVLLGDASAFVSDDAVIADVEAAIPPGHAVSVVIEESSTAGSSPALSFEGGLATRQLQAGAQSVTLLISPGATARRAAFVARDGAGGTLAKRAFALVDPPPDPTFAWLFLHPDELVLDGETTRAQVAAGGVLADGRVVNLTRDAPRTEFTSQRNVVATISALGEVEARGGGLTTVQAARDGLIATAVVRVDQPPTLVGLVANSPLTFIVAGPHALGFRALLSDASELDATDVTGITFSISDPAVVSVDATGRATALADGEASITATHGTLTAVVRVAVELRAPPALQAIDLLPFSAAVPADVGQTVATARLAGSGQLHGLIVTFVRAGAAPAVAVTNFKGVASATLAGLSSAGALTVTAAVTDPQSGAVLSDSEQLLILAGAGDNEPNSSDATASRLLESTPVSGALSSTDTRDVFTLDDVLAGTWHVVIGLDAVPATNALALVVRDANGVEISRTALMLQNTEVSVAAAPGGFLAIESNGVSASYTLTVRFEQGPIQITTVTPTSGPPGTSIVITGTGFSARAADVLVTFAGVEGKVVSVSPTRIDAVVPANAVDGELGILVGNRSVQGLRFVVGNAGPLAPAFTAASNPAMQRRDVVSGAVIDVSRLWVDFDVVVTRAQVDQILAGHSGNVVGFLPMFNRYLVEFAGNTTTAGIRARQAALAALPSVRRVLAVSFSRNDADRSIDMGPRSGFWQNGAARSEPFELAKVFDALHAVRSTPPFDNPFNLRKVRVAVIDSGFQPFVPSEFPGTIIVRGLVQMGGATLLADISPKDFTSAHGTAVSGIIAAANDGTSSSGVVSSLLRQDESAFIPGLIELIVYACGTPPDGAGLDDVCIENALYEIAARGDVDVVNMSFGKSDYADELSGVGCLNEGTSFPGAEASCEYYPFFRHVRSRTLFVVAGGNLGIQASNTYPASLSQQLENVISVGAVAVVDVDGSGEGADQRAQFYSILRPANGIHPSEVTCNGATKKASNCGPGVSVSAPGEDYWTTGSDVFPGVDYQYFNGTSSAAPLVSGIAAMLQVVRPSASPFAPGELKAAIVDTADDISSTWRTVPSQAMGRVNALAAVRRVLPAVTKQRIYVTDQAEGNAVGHVTAININPLDGAVTGTSLEIPLELTKNGVTVKGHRPTAVVISAAFEQAFVLTASDQPGGDGLFVINTKSDAVEAFIPLTGDTFPSTAAFPLLPIHTTLKSAMVATRDGRVVFVSANDRIHVVDVNTGLAVRNLNQLTWLSNVKRPIPSTLLVLRDADVRQAVNAVGGQITSLSLSPDERTLYAAVHAGGGTGLQPGFVMEIDVALDIDSNPNTPSVELDLSGFFGLKGQPRLGHDEPSGVAAAPDGSHVYLTNGGVQSFTAVVQSTGVLTALKAFAANIFSTPFIDAVAADLASRGSYTQLLAAGRVQAFEIGAGSLGGEVWSFPSELSSVWTPTKPVVSDQFIRRRVNSERTFGMAFRFDSKRALVPFFQTGNFGVLDLEFQAAQPQHAPAGVFQGLVAVTPSLNLDAFLWPPPEEESSLYPSAIAYAQNGRFAAAVHVGARTGALTVLNDALITDDLLVHDNVEVPNPDPGGTGNVPFLAVRPLCGARASADTADCLVDVLQTHTSYAVSGGSGTASFTRPRGLAIQPFLTITRPLFGERVRSGNALMFDWRDGRAARYRVEILDQGHVLFGAAAPGVTVVPSTAVLLTADQRHKQTVKRTLADLFANGPAPQDNHRYRIEVRLETVGGELLGREIVEMVFRR